MKKVLLFFTIFLLPLFVFLYHLQDNPPGFFIDEAINGSEAYTLLQTHGFSSTGEFLPRLFNFAGGDGTRNHHAFIYYIIPFIWLFGLTEVAVRLTSVFASIGLLFVVYVLVRKRVSLPSFLLGAVCWSFISWVFLLSRIGMEFITTAFLFMAVLFLLERLSDAKPGKINRLIIVLGIAIGMLFYVYAAGKVLAVGSMGLAIWIAVRKKLPFNQVMLLGSLFLGTFLLSYQYIHDGSFFYRSSELTRCDVGPIACFVEKFATHLSFPSYFAPTYIPPDFFVYTHSIIGTSLIPLFLSPFLCIGLWFLIRSALRGDFFSRLVIIAALLAMVPGSLTIRGFDSYRSVALLPILFICIIFGIDTTLRFFRRKSMRFYFSAIGVLSVCFSLFIFREAQLLFAYEYRHEAATYGGWQYGYNEVFRYVKKHDQEYDTIFITKTVAFFPSQYIQFFDPKKRYPNISILTPEFIPSGRVLYVLRPEDISSSGIPLENLIIKHIVFYPDKKHQAFIIGEYKK